MKQTLTVLWLFFSGTPDSLGATKALQEAVGDNLQTGSAVLLEAFEQSQYLAIGEANHTKKTTPKMIAEFLAHLRRVQDKSLRYIFVERSYELASFFEYLSLGLSEQYSLSVEESTALCFNFPNNTYLIREIAREVQKINQRRSAGDKLLIVPVDGTSLQVQFVVPEVRRKHCRPPVANIFASPQYVFSYDREADTARIVANWMDSLKPGDKALFYFHNMHLIQHLEACLPGTTNAHQTSRGLSPINWPSLLFIDRPHLRSDTAIVLMDQKDSEYGGETGIFDLSSNLEKAGSGGAVGVQLSSLRSFLQDKVGVGVFARKLVFDAYSRTLYGNQSLDKMADYLIWIPGGVEQDRAEDMSSLEMCGHLWQSY